MIVGRRYEPLLKMAVETLLPIVKDIVIVDTDPGVNPNIDNMRSIAGARIIELPRKSDADFSFGVARQTALDNTKTEWVVITDTDDVLHEKYLEELEYYTTTDCSAVGCHFWWHVLHPDYYQEIHGNMKCLAYKVADLKWERKVHEQPTINGPVVSAMHIRQNHYGWCLKSQREILERYQYYYELGSGEPPPCVNDPDHWLDYRFNDGSLIRFPEEHPTVVKEKLKELFPDLGVSSLLRGE